MVGVALGLFGDQIREDTTNQIILEEMLTGMSNVPESLLLHPVLSGALLRDFVPRCANYLTTSFDDMCEREILFITVLRFVTKLTSYGTDYQHLWNQWVHCNSWVCSEV